MVGMPEAVVLREIALRDRHVATGNARHFVGGELMPRPARLRISRYADDPGFYLLYIGDAGEELTDTWHPTLEDAMQQAAFEFDVKPNDWEILADGP